jgi:DNA-binding beta-propeller fold protein YncE
VRREEPTAAAAAASGRRVLHVFLAALGVLAVTAGAAEAAAHPPRRQRNSPASLSVGRATRHFEYVFAAGVVDVYDIDHGNRLVQQFPLPETASATGVAADPRRGILFLSYVSQDAAAGTGSLLAYDLVQGRMLWRRSYASGADSLALSSDGRTIYLPAGEDSGSGHWAVIDAATGAVTGSIKAGAGAHDGIAGPSGRYVYLGGVDYPYLIVASTATNRVVRRVGPLHGPGVRPFVINRAETLALTTARSYLGFQVSSLTSGRVVYDVAPPGFRFDPARFGRTPDHGIALSPDSRQLYLIDTPNGYVHVFDLTGLPARRPRDVADIKLAHPPPNDGWLQISRDGRYLYVGRAGDVIDTRRRSVVGFLPPLAETADFCEIDWRHGRPVSTTSRFSLTTP